MGEDEIRRWTDQYVRAWTTNEAADIEALFAEDATYYTAPFRKPWTGRQAIVDSWLKRKDEQGGWQFRYEVIGVAGRLGFVRGWTVYPDVRYSNLWVIRLADGGPCEEFTEWWMEEK
jgi:ketosteroid isomerase-like protein